MQWTSSATHGFTTGSAWTPFAADVASLGGASFTMIDGGGKHRQHRSSSNPGFSRANSDRARRSTTAHL